MRKALLFSLALLLATSAGFAYHQQSTQNEEAQLILDLLKAEQDVSLYAAAPDSKIKVLASDRIAQLYATIAARPAASNALLSKTIRDFIDSKTIAKGAAQVSQAADEASVRLQALQAMQNQTLIQQNQRIIELLEQISKKK